MRIASLFILLLTVLQGYAQQQALKTLSHDDFRIWKTLEDPSITADGRYIAYRLVTGEGDPQLQIYDTLTSVTRTISRVSKAGFDYNGQYVFGLIKPHRDSLRALERKKVDKNEWPGDTLFIADAGGGNLIRIADVKEYKTPSRVGDVLAYVIREKSNTQNGDTDKKSKGKAGKAEHLIVRQLSTGREDTLKYVKEFTWAERAPILIAWQDHIDSLQTGGVAYWLDFDWKYIKRQKGKYGQLSAAPYGTQLAFQANYDTTKAQAEPWELFYFDFKSDSAMAIAAKERSAFPLVNPHEALKWSEDGKYLFYGRSVMPVIRDTTLLPDEIVDVEVWSTRDPMLYTMQNIQLAKEQKRAYIFAYDTDAGNHIQVSSLQWESAAFSPERKGRYAVVYTEKPYQIELTWMEGNRMDLGRIDLLTGAITPIKKGMQTTVRVSPGGQYAYGYSYPDKNWWVYHLPTGNFAWMPNEGLPQFFDELHDTPGHPGSYGLAGWIQQDQSVILYDRYDLWAWSPNTGEKPARLTQGRENNYQYRLIRTDRERHDISPAEPWLLQVTDVVSKSEGYTWFQPADFSVADVTLTPFHFSSNVNKAREADVYLFTKESFEIFPDLQISHDRFVSSKRISDANPQQKDYAWGSIRLYQWIDFDSMPRTGLLVLPAGYDRYRTYPTIVNFYDRSSDDLHHHRTLQPHRSTINYAFYASRGYVIFNPDISYETGLPGESAYQIVVSGVTSLVRDNIADYENLALQGHSWGGYQIAYILTRTNMFTCAEAGAAVVNMTSAYGGIRGETGRARLFQYEQGQSRLGATLWEDPDLYLQNSPLFKINKIETPLLLMHNDKDGHVPFEQGIEFYLALRRLDKKAWLLNYRGEPHWPLKWHQRMDFQRRMSEFFDHYLMGKPMPEWMEKGVPAIERGLK